MDLTEPVLGPAPDDGVAAPPVPGPMPGRMPVDRPTAALIADASRMLGHALVDPHVLGGSSRSLVLRCRVLGHRGAQSVVLKRFAPPFAAEFARERAGLTELTGTPDLLAADERSRTLVMTDLGVHATLADLLLGQDREAAWQAAVGWAGALGDLLGRSHGVAPQVASRLEPEVTEIAELLRRGLARIEELFGVRGVAQAAPTGPASPAGAAPDAAAELEVLVAAVTDPVPARLVVSPGDTCPDNALLTPDGWRFLDLEGTSVHDAAVDAAYAVLPFASCWCVFDPPIGLTDAMVDALSEALATHVELGRTWRRDVDLAAAAFVLASSEWLWQGAVDGRRVGGEGVRSPRHRELLTARWWWGAQHLAEVTPAIAGLCGRAARWAVREWGGATPGPYPAFAGSAG